MHLAGVLIKYLPEVFKELDRCSAKSGVGQLQQRTVLVVLAEVIGGHPWNVIAEHPGALVSYIADAIERVEVSGLTIIGLRYQRAVSPNTRTRADARVRDPELDARQV